jgi:V8-like Glu-specific endopeptidase
VLVELWSPPGAAPSRVEIARLQHGIHDEDVMASLCGASDQRALSGAPPAEPDARIRPVGCSGWLIRERCLITAGHCTTNPPQVHGSPFDANMMQVAEFRVPLSNPNGSINFSHPDHQYPVQSTSIQFQSLSCAVDWCQFGVFPNSNTGLTPIQAGQTMYTLAGVAPPAGGQLIRIRGYGTTTGTDAPNTWNQVLTFHWGSYISLSGTLVQYTADTTGGNSGSAIFLGTTNTVIGVHACGGCNPPNEGNRGTAIHHGPLQNALNNPLGSCLATGPPPPNDVCQNAILVQCNTTVSGSTANATFTDRGFCGTSHTANDVWYRLVGTGGQIEVNTCGPVLGYDTKLTVWTGTCTNLVCVGGNDDMGAACPTSGLLSRVVFNSVVGQTYYIMVHGFSQGAGPFDLNIVCAAPPNDVCQNAIPVQCNTTVSGSTAAASFTNQGLCGTSHTTNDVWYRLTGTGAQIEVNTCGPVFGYDTKLTVWTGTCSNLVCVGGNDDYPCPTNGLLSQVIFDSVAGQTYYIMVHGFSQGAGPFDLNIVCAEPQTCPWDLNGDNNVDVLDLLVLLDAWGPNPGHPADFNGDGSVDVLDLLKLLDNWGPCPLGACTVGFVCGGDIPWCNEPEFCACITAFDGTIHCLFAGVACGQSCPTGSCPAGQICVVDTCCSGGAPICVDAVFCEPSPPGCDDGFTCGQPDIDCPTSDDPACVCLHTFGGGIECGRHGPCSNPCPDGFCPPGYICAVDTCCAGPVCLLACLTCEDHFQCGVPFPDGYCEEGCLCVATFDGDKVCLTGAAPCGPACNDGNCPPGQVCITNTCCGTTNCVDEAWLDCGSPLTATDHRGPTVGGDAAIARPRTHDALYGPRSDDFK